MGTGNGGDAKGIGKVEPAGIKGCLKKKEDETKPPGNINKIKSVEKTNEDWEIIDVTVDSGAVDNVVPEEIGEQFEVKETRMSKKGGITRQPMGQTYTIKEKGISWEGRKKGHQR